MPRATAADLAGLRAAALAVGEELLALDPVLGEPGVQRAVDAFVEQAADALRALAARAGADRHDEASARHTSGWERR